MNGPTGPTGPTGPVGPQGVATTIRGSYTTPADLTAAHPTGSAGDSYIVGGNLYVWNGTTNTWSDVGAIRGPQGPAGTPAVTQYGSVYNGAALTLSNGAALTFANSAAMSGVTINSARDTITLVSAGPWRISVGVDVSGYTGTPALNLRAGGTSGTISVPIVANGMTSFEWIAEYGANTNIGFTVSGGQITTTSGTGSAYLTATKYNT